MHFMGLALHISSIKLEATQKLNQFLGPNDYQQLSFGINEKQKLQLSLSVYVKLCNVSDSYTV